MKSYYKSSSKSKSAKAILLFSLMFCSIIIAEAQISIDQSDMPSVDDTLRISTGLNLDFIDYAQSGEDYDWDFSQLVPIHQRVDTFQDPWSMALIYKLYFGLFSNLAVRAAENLPVPGFPFSDVYNFYDKSPGDFRAVGLGVSIAGIPIPFKYDNPDLIYDFPLNYQDQWSSQAYFAESIPGMGYLRMSKTHSDTVDGWGTLTTPYGTFDVLRIKSEIIENDSLYLDSLEVGIPVNRNYTVYQWVGKGQKLPLLQITSGLAGLIVDYVDSARVIVEGIDQTEIVKNNKINIFPNPAKDIVNISFDMRETSHVNLKLFDLKGMEIADIFNGNIEQGQSNITFSFMEFGTTPGIYIVQLKSGGSLISKRVIYTP
ncbi:MAG: T9SS type A sorting domain-containing protein [Chlorobi bacterium]|nr:T9SS type A sorting domain-containing protein [Chlorobiota bacterium]